MFRSLFIVLCCLSAALTRRLNIRSVHDNEVDASSSSSESFEAPRVDSWVRITKFPPKEVTVNFGEIVELECEAHGGYPAPIIQWYKDTIKVTDNERFSNVISSYPLKGLANAKAKLRIVAAQTEIFFCRAQSGNKMAKASTKVIVVGKGLSEFIANEIRQLKAEPRKDELDGARIVFYDTIYMNNIGNTAEFPCKSVGNPSPDSIWLGPNNQYIEPGADHRFTILPSGGLRINGLRWNDMGPYTCVAKNDHGEDSIQTFLYPMLADK
nr:neural/ectodermal development factor IMP-L2 [Onthophagus taurus]